MLTEPYPLQLYKNNNILTIRSAFDLYKRCLERSTNKCDPPQRKVFEGSFKVSEFIWNDGREGKETFDAKKTEIKSFHFFTGTFLLLMKSCTACVHSSCYVCSVTYRWWEPLTYIMPVTDV